MSGNIFQTVKAALSTRLPEILPQLLPGGRSNGREYLCASLEGGAGNSCRTNLESGVGSDFATGETWADVIDLTARVRGLRPYEAARELAQAYRLDTAPPQHSPAASGHAGRKQAQIVCPVPVTAPEPPRHHPQHGQCSQMWRYQDAQGNTLGYTARFDSTATDGGKVILPLCFGSYGHERPRWLWKSLPAPRPLYGLAGLANMSAAPVLLVEGEKAADAAQALLPEYAVLTWSGGANAVSKADWTPLRGRDVTIWPDNDETGHAAAQSIANILHGLANFVRIVQLPGTLSAKWDLADPVPAGLDVRACLHAALPANRQGNLTTSDPVATEESLELRQWPHFPMEAACPGLLGDFVRLTTRNSEADPAAVCVTALVRFCAEVYGHAPNKGPHIFVGETLHPPRLFAIICGNSSKARKGTSRQPVMRLFGRKYCVPEELAKLGLPLPARETGGPLSTGEGLAFHLREHTDSEREDIFKQHPDAVLHDKGDKRLVVMDEEFASALACIKREGNTLSMGIRCFWDSGDYAPLTKHIPVEVKGAHVNILGHITMQELEVALTNVQVFNGFANRFLWICARRTKLVPMPAPMPEAEVAPMQRQLWELVAFAQSLGRVDLSPRAHDLWCSIYPELSKDHTGMVGSIINRAEAQTLRLALAYALWDGQKQIDETHLRAALALWGYAQESAQYIFQHRDADPLEAKVLAALKNGPLSATELSRVFSGNISRERLRPVLQQLEARQKIRLCRQKTEGRPRLVISLCDACSKNEINEIDERNEKRGATT